MGKTWQILVRESSKMWQGSVEKCIEQLKLLENVSVAISGMVQTFSARFSSMYTIEN